MFFEQLLFFVAGLLALGGAFGVVTLQNQFYSVLSLIAHLLGLAVLFLPGRYVAARRRLHDKRRLRCDWIVALK